jgi:hypothetical protein
MLKDVLADIEKTKPLRLDSELGFALLIEMAVRQLTAYTYAEFDCPAEGIPHLERILVISDYLGSPASTMSSKSSIPIMIARTRIILLDLRERAGVVESMDKELAEMEQWWSDRREVLGEKQALAGIRGALLGRRGDFAGGEKLLLARYATLAQVNNSDAEFLQGERVTTVRRLVNLYRAWGRPHEAAKWASKLPPN